MILNIQTHVSTENNLKIKEM